MKLTIEQVQEISCELFRTVAQILEEEDFPYVGFYGTMLGTVRHQGPIPWDADVDVLIPEPELNRFLELMKRKLPSEYWLDFGNPDKPERAIPRIGLAGYETRVIHVDVFRMVGYPKQHWKQIIYSGLCSTLISIRCAKVYTYTGKKKLLAGLVRALTFYHNADYYAQRYHKLCKRYPYEMAEIIGNAADRDDVGKAFTKEIFDYIKMPYAGFTIRIPKNYDELLCKLYGNYLQLPPEKERNAAMQNTYEIRELA